MLTTAQLLEPLAARRTDEIVVLTMSTVRPWGLLSDSPLDFASADSAMGHAADLALGIALARPDRRVICVNGDGSMLMCLGTLATAVGAAASNFLLFVADNGEYEITGHQPVAAAGRLDHAALAEAAGFRHVFRFEEARPYATALPDILDLSGPTFVHLLVEPGDEGPIARGPTERARYLQTSLADWAAVFRAELASRRGP
jgi:sulfopyruvate decarboxylase subunit beta